MSRLLFAPQPPAQPVPVPTEIHPAPAPAFLSKEVPFQAGDSVRCTLRPRERGTVVWVVGQEVGIRYAGEHDVSTVHVSTVSA